MTDQPDRPAPDAVSWKSYVDAIFAEHRVQVQAALTAHDNRVTADQKAMNERLEALRRELEAMFSPVQGVELREHVEALFTESRRAAEIAEREKLQAATVLRSEQQRAQDVAEREREKAAQALATSLERGIREGDERLREHIGNQVEQINAALGGVESRAQLRHDAHRTQLDDRFGYTEEAVAKAEKANEKRFECVAADTPILCADLIWRPAGGLAVGDELIGFDEQSYTRRGRMYRRSIVTANDPAEDRLLEVATSFGAVRCNPNHPWLARREQTSTWVPPWEWIEASDLEAGHEVLHTVAPWEVEKSWEAGWLAGMFDGEGCLCLDKNGRAQLSVTQRESATADLLAAELERHLGQPSPVFLRKDGEAHWCNHLTFIVSNRAHSMRLLGIVRPPRLLGRADGVWDGKPIGGMGKVGTVASVTDVGSGTIARLSTSTATYIAAGFAMHNSVNSFREQLADQASHFLPREVAATEFSNSQRRIEGVQEALTGMRGNFVTREAFEARVDELQKQVARLTEALGKLT